jgi:hypothetical protein
MNDKTKCGLDFGLVKAVYYVIPGTHYTLQQWLFTS